MTSKKPTEAEVAAEAASQQVHETVNRGNAQGFRGDAVDGTDDFNYTVAGVISGAPVPEATANPRAATTAAARKVR